MLGFTRLRLRQPPNLRRPVYEVAVYNWIGRFIRGRGWFGTTIDFGLFVLILYFRRPEGVHPLFRVHEFQHVFQCFRAGWPRCILNYVTALLRHGYRDNPLEVEAYAVQRRAYEEGLPDWAE